MNKRKGFSRKEREGRKKENSLLKSKKRDRYGVPFSQEQSRNLKKPNILSKKRVPMT